MNYLKSPDYRWALRIYKNSDLENDLSCNFDIHTPTKCIPFHIFVTLQNIYVLLPINNAKEDNDQFRSINKWHLLTQYKLDFNFFYHIKIYTTTRSLKISCIFFFKYMTQLLVIYYNVDTTILLWYNYSKKKKTGV